MTKVMEKLILGVMFSTAVIGLIVVIGAMVIGEMDYNQINYISLSGE